MSPFTSRLLFGVGLAIVLLSCSVDAHAWLSDPKPRGQYITPPKASWEEYKPASHDPNDVNFVCRNDPVMPRDAWVDMRAGQSQSITISFNARHVGDCFVYLTYDGDKATNQQKWFKIWEQHSCKDQDNYSIPIPSYLPTGEHVIFRWEWYALHIYPTVEYFSSCFDATISGSSNGVLPQPQVNMPGHLPALSGNYADNTNNYWWPWDNQAMFFTGPPVATADGKPATIAPNKPTTAPPPAEATTKPITITPAPNTPTKAASNPTKGPVTGGDCVAVPNKGVTDAWCRIVNCDAAYVDFCQRTGGSATEAPKATSAPATAAPSKPTAGPATAAPSKPTEAPKATAAPATAAPSKPTAGPATAAPSKPTAQPATTAPKATVAPSQSVKLAVLEASSKWWLSVAPSGHRSAEIAKMEVMDSKNYPSFTPMVHGWSTVWNFQPDTRGELTYPLTVKASLPSGSFILFTVNGPLSTQVDSGIVFP